MHKITISLLTIILFATLGLGLTLNVIYKSYANSDQGSVEGTYEFNRQLGLQLSKVVGRLADPQQFISAWNEQHETQISIVDAGYYALSNDVEFDIEVSGPLIFEDSSGVQFNYALPGVNKILVLNTPPSVAKSTYSTRLIYTGVFYFGLLLAAAAWLWPLLQRLHKLRTTAQSFGSGNLSARTRTSSWSYISDIEAEFNRMADKTVRLIDDIKLLSSALSHEMRAPLAKLRFGLDTLMEEESPQIRRQYERRISGTLDDLTGLVDATLQFARMDYLLCNAETNPVDLVALVQGSIAKCSDSKKAFSFDSELSQFSVRANEFYLSMLVDNLLDNAEKHSRSWVRISIERQGDGVLLQVEDDGEGVSSDSKEALFSPFYRGQGRKQNGFGLGLAVVSRIGGWYGAHVDVSSSYALGGASFRIKFPAGGENLGPSS